ncbi:MAG: anti-sigma factor antagonist [Eubacteriaceae bacterium]|nr:anti-sigma factor antagonist [Eubacteriaceae bacterium]
METELLYVCEDNSLTVRLCGEVDHHISTGIRESIDFMLDECSVKTVVFDFSRVTFMDSSGIGIVLGRYNKMKASGGRVVIRNASGLVKQILEMSGVFSLMKYEEGEEGDAEHEKQL